MGDLSKQKFIKSRLI